MCRHTRDRGADMATFNIWMNGKLVPQEQAVLPVNSAAVFYATNVFEGIRSYWSERDGEMYSFRLADHFARLRESMKMMRFTIPYSDDQLFEAVRTVVARKGRIVTPHSSSDILESITRTTLIEYICPQVLGMEVVERDIDRTELYVAEEAFFCGSGYEITPILSIDRFGLGSGDVGPVTKRISSAYLDLVRGIDRKHPEWRTPTY